MVRTLLISSFVAIFLFLSVLEVLSDYCHIDFSLKYLIVSIVIGASFWIAVEIYNLLASICDDDFLE